jgi:hypothetical protein
MPGNATSTPPAWLAPHLPPQVQGTCLGMETLSIIISGNYSILSRFDAEDNGE